jgi:hypothetical protein
MLHTMYGSLWYLCHSEIRKKVCMLKQSCTRMCEYVCFPLCCFGGNSFLPFKCQFFGRLWDFEIKRCLDMADCESWGLGNITTCACLSSWAFLNAICNFFVSPSVSKWYLQVAHNTCTIIMYGPLVPAAEALCSACSLVVTTQECNLYFYTYRRRQSTE